MSDLLTYHIWNKLCNITKHERYNSKVFADYYHLFVKLRNQIEGETDIQRMIRIYKG